MPELPEVETIARALSTPLIGRTIMGVETDWPKHVDRPDLPELKQRISGRRILSVGRRGKYLLFSLSEGETLIIHLRITGHLSVVAAAAPLTPYDHTRFLLDTGDELRFRDQRKLGRVYLVKQPLEVLGKLGPEPLPPAFTMDTLRARLTRRKRAIKPLLLDQRFIAGVGNIYADEALFDAGIHPTRRADTLTETEQAALYAAIVKVLQLGIEKQGATIDNYRKPDDTLGNMQEKFMVYGRKGEPCYLCRSRVKRIVLGGRGTNFCPHCQK
ncbi:MAG: DNA-formamidopyrimidine glycosylase [Anaerolineae bacterium]